MTLINARRLDTSPIPYVVDRVIPLVGSGFAHGPSGAGKSYALVTKLGLDVANGVPWFGHETIQGPVVTALGEGLQDAGIRIKAQLAQHAEDNAAAVAAVLAEEGPEAAEKFESGLPPYTDNFLIVETEPFAMPVEPDGKPSVSMQQFIASVAGVEPIMVIYDAMADFSGGLSIVNDTAANRYAMGLKYLVAKLDCFILGIGHDTEKGDKMLGAGRFKNAADIMIGIKPEAGDGYVSTVISEKAKAGPKFDAFSYMAVPKIWDEPILDGDGNFTGETERVETNVVMLREDAEDDGTAFVMPEAARALPVLALPDMRTATPPKRKRNGIRAAAPAEPEELSVACLECGAPVTRGCNPLPESDYTTPAPGVDVHVSRAARLTERTAS